MSRDPSLRSRLLIGAIAGIVGTLAVTAAMRRLHRRQPGPEHHPPPSREGVDSTTVRAGAPPADQPAADLTTASLFACGAACGSLIGAANPRIGAATGAVAGVCAWVASYLGWLPGMGILQPATLNPKRRNALMIGVHLVWGVATALAMRELVLAHDDIIAAGEDV